MEMSLTIGVWIHVDYSFKHVQAAWRGHSAVKSADPVCSLCSSDTGNVGKRTISFEVLKESGNGTL